MQGGVSSIILYLGQRERASKGASKQARTCAFLPHIHFDVHGVQMGQGKDGCSGCRVTVQIRKIATSLSLLLRLNSSVRLHFVFLSVVISVSPHFPFLDLFLFLFYFCPCIIYGSRLVPNVRCLFGLRALNFWPLTAQIAYSTRLFTTIFSLVACGSHGEVPLMIEDVVLSVALSRFRMSSCS